jgi:hypothetical protein
MEQFALGAADSLVHRDSCLCSDGLFSWWIDFGGRWTGRRKKKMMTMTSLYQMNTSSYRRHRHRSNFYDVDRAGVYLNICHVYYHDDADGGDHFYGDDDVQRWYHGVLTHRQRE